MYVDKRNRCCGSILQRCCSYDMHWEFNSGREKTYAQYLWFGISPRMYVDNRPFQQNPLSLFTTNESIIRRSVYPLILNNALQNCHCILRVPSCTIVMLTKAITFDFQPLPNPLKHMFDAKCSNMTSMGEFWHNDANHAYVYDWRRFISVNVSGTPTESLV